MRWAGRRATGTAAAVAALLTVLAGCGGGGAATGTGRAAAGRPGCQDSVRVALADALGSHAVHARLVSGGAQDVICSYRAGAERLTVEVQSVPQAYEVYNTAAVHQVQANLGRSAATTRLVPGVGVVASWIPSEHELITTNGTLRRGGAFVRVTMRRHAHGAPSDVAVARRVASAALRTAPRGPDPAPPSG